MYRSNFDSPFVSSRRIAAASVALLLVGFASTSAAQTTGGQAEKETSTQVGQTDDRSLRDKVSYLLGGYHFVPERETFDELAEPEQLRATFRSIATDEEARPSLRMRAVDSLALYPNDDVRSFLESLADAPSEDLSEQQRRVAGLMRHHAITGIARMVDGEEATVAALEGYLADENFQVQLTAVAALGRYAGEAGAERLSALAKSTDDTILREEIGKYTALPEGKNSVE